MHLAILHRKVDLFKPSMIVADPISALASAGNQYDVTAMLTRLIDFLKTRLITFLMSSLVSEGKMVEESEANISSLIDVWFLQQNVTVGGERNHTFYVTKARGIPHSNQFREYTITSNGIQLSDPYLGTQGVLTGSARLFQEAREKAETILRQQDVVRREADVERKRKAMEAQVENLRAEFAAEEGSLKTFVLQEAVRKRLLSEDRAAMAVSRRLNPPKPKHSPRRGGNR
jgi:circadian clock protein KaiC